MTIRTASTSLRKRFSRKYYDEKILPKTAAVNVAEYIDHLSHGSEPVTKSFISISAVPSPVPIRIAVLRLKNLDMSMSLTVALFPAEQDSLSVMPEKMIRQGMSADAIADVLRQRTEKCHASFILDTPYIFFMPAGVAPP